MPQPLRVGFLGGGLDSAIGRSHHAAALMDGAWSIGPCLFSNDETVNRATHDAYGLPWSGHHDQIAEWIHDRGSDMDLVVILTPSTLHAQHAITLASLGVSFLVEKPVACSVRDAHAVLAAVEKAGVYARFVHNYSAFPMARDFILRLREGNIGPVHHLRLVMPSDGFAREHATGPPQPWRQHDTEVPMMLLDLGTHLHHFARLAVHEGPGRIQARLRSDVNRFGVIDNAEIWEERDDGTSLTYWMSKAHLGFKNGLRVEAYGSRGSLIWSLDHADHLQVVDGDSNVTWVNRGVIRGDLARYERFKAGHPTGFIEAMGSFYTDLAEDFRAWRRGVEGVSWIRPLEEGVAAVEFLAAATSAARRGSWLSTHVV